MSQRARLEAAAAALEPDLQGRLDGLCGVYATINGIRVALYPVELQPAQRKRLFAAGTNALQRAKLLGLVVHDGMSAAVLRKVSRAIADEAGVMLGVRIGLIPAVPPRDRTSRFLVVRAVRRQLKLGRPVLVTLWGAYNHTTIVTGFSRLRLALFDSWGHRWVAINSLAVGAEEGRHRLVARQMLAISVDMPP